MGCLDHGGEELRDKLCNAWVFHTTFENGTSLRSGEKGFQAIGTRIHYQLLPHKLSDDIISLTVKICVYVERLWGLGYTVWYAVISIG